MGRGTSGADERDGLPIFYKEPRPLNPTAGEGYSLQASGDFAFVRSTNSIVLGAVEFPAAMRFYPIVFTACEPAAAVAVLGLEGDANLFVGADGSWRSGHYVPAYVRRYPFLLWEQPEKNELVLCIDAGSDLLTRSNERPLFANGEATPLVCEALAFCCDFHQQTTIAAAFAAAAKKEGVLVSNQARLGLVSGRQVTLQGFQIIDEAKFNALPDDVFLDWRHRGWLPLVYCHFLSMDRWRALAEMAERQRPDHERQTIMAAEAMQG